MSWSARSPPIARSEAVSSHLTWLISESLPAPGGAGGLELFWFISFTKSASGLITESVDTKLDRRRAAIIERKKSAKDMRKIIWASLIVTAAATAGHTQTFTNLESFNGGNGAGPWRVT
jgi:hypothetical protein